MKRPYQVLEILKQQLRISPVPQLAAKQRELNLMESWRLVRARWPDGRLSLEREVIVVEMPYLNSKS